MSNPLDPMAASINTANLKEVNLQKAKAEVTGQHIKNVTEAVKSIGIVLALVLGAWANFTKASSSDVEENRAAAKASFVEVAGDLENQHEQTEKIRETVKGTTEAVKSIASALPPSSPPSIPIDNKEPDEKGCWTVYGGIVRCKGLNEGAEGTERSYVPVDVPETPPAAPLPSMPAKRVELGF